MLKSFLKKTFVFDIVKYYRKVVPEGNINNANNKILREWDEKGRPVPPPHFYKISVVKDYGNKFQLDVLIETGTYMGDTIEACKNFFKKLISIELNKTLFENAKLKFSQDPNIILYQGDSGYLLKEILLNTSEPCLFWLDGHYSEGITSKGELNTPILNELKHIFAHQNKKDVILIDDARCFTGEDDYPSIEGLKNLVYNYNPELQFFIQDDIVRIHL